MFLKCSERRKNGKVHRSWSVVESRRFPGGKVAQRHVLYLGELNDSQQRAWERSLAVFDEQTGEHRQLALFPADRPLPATETETVQVRLDQLRLENPRQWGACWLGDHLWRTLHLDDFFGARLPVSREDTDWEKVLRILVIHRLLAPGSEWRLHRNWFSTTALPDLLGVDARAAQDDTLYRCHDRLLAHKEELFGHLRERWSDLFSAKFDVLLYDLTWSRPRGCRWPTRCFRATPRTRPRCAPCWRKSARASAPPSASGSWTGASPPRPSSRSCAGRTWACVISWARPRAG